MFGCIRMRIDEAVRRSLIQAGEAQQMPIAMARHPFRASKMTVERTASAIRLADRIDMQHDARDFPPVGTVSVGVEEPQIGDHVLLVVGCQHRLAGSQIGDIWIDRWSRHETPIALETKNPGMKAGAMMPQRTSGRDDQRTYSARFLKKL